MDENKLSETLNSENKCCKSGDVAYCKLTESGVKLPSNVSSRLPNDFIVIGCLEKEFFKAIHNLNRQDVIGLSLEGFDIGRSGTLEWLNISSSTCTYLFNIASLGKDAFDKGLKMIVESKRIVKVFHDCRRAADCFYHQYNTKPSNVFDTQVADFVVNAIKKNVELITNKVNSLNYCLELYLNVPKECLCEHFNAAVKFSSLPLNHTLLQFLVKNVIYLRILKQELDMILRMPFRRCIDVYLNVILRKPDHELKLHCPDLDLVPPELVIENMQVFKFTEKLKPPDICKPEVKDDPVTRYERDCRKYQQQYGYGKFTSDKEFETGLDYENVDGGWSYSNRSEIIQFLLDKMFACDSTDRSVISMTPFESSDRHDCSVESENYVGHNMDIKDDSSVMSESKALSVPDCLPKKSRSSERDLSPRSRPLQRQINLPFENRNASDNCTSPVNANVSVVKIKLSNDFTLPDAKKSSNLKTVESVSSDSSLSRKSLVYKRFAEQKCQLSSQEQLPSKSTFIGKNSMSLQDTGLVSPKRNSNDLKDSACDNSSDSSLSGKSQVYKIFAEQKRLLKGQNQLLSKSAIFDKESVIDVDLFSTKESCHGVKQSVSNDSSDSSLSKKSQVYKIFAEQKRLMTSEILPSRMATSAEDSRSDAALPSVDLNLNCTIDSICDTSINKKPSSSNSSHLHKSLSLSDAGSSISSNKHQSILLKEASLHSHVDKELHSNQQSTLNSNDGNTGSIKGRNSLEKKSLNVLEIRDWASNDVDDVDLHPLEKDNFCADVQSEDPWTRLRGAFAELGPTKYSSKKVVFIPAGMQY